MGDGREQIQREGVPFHHDREQEGPSGVVECVATWKLELGCMPGSVAMGRPVVLDGCGWRQKHGSELWRSRGVMELVQVQPRCCVLIRKKRCRFSPAEDIQLFREVLSPFARASPAWDAISQAFKARGKMFSSHLCRDRVRAAVKDFVKADNKERNN